MTTSSTEPVNLVVVGAGLIGCAHIRAIAANPQCRLAAIVDPDSKTKMADGHGAWYESNLKKLLEKRDRLGTFLDAVIIATPNKLHYEQAIQCIHAGLPILLEKPIADTLDQAQEITELAEKRAVPVLIGHHRAHSPIMALAKEVIAQGKLGDIVAIQGGALFFKPDHYFQAGPWRKEKGGGPIALNLIHEIHNLRMLCGEISAVQALTSHARRGFKVEDSAVINFHFANGALGSFVLSDTAASAKSWEQTTGENPDYAHYEDENCYHIAGTLGSLSVPSMRLKTWNRSDERSWYTPFQCSTLALERRDPLQLQMQHFVQVVRGQAAPLVSAHSGLQNLKVAHAIMQAAATGKTVAISSM